MMASRLGRSLVRQHGMAAMMTMIFLLVVVSFAAVTLLRLSASDLIDSTAQGDAAAALFLAESGVERASNRLSNGTACGNALLDAAPIALGRGTFQVINPAPVIVAGGRCRITVSGIVNSTRRNLQVDLNYSVAWLANTSNNSNASVVNHAWNHTVPATGSNRVLVVGIAIRNSTGQTVVPLPANGVTYGPGAGAPLTRIGTVATNSTNVSTELWMLVNPPSGGNYPVRVTLTAPAKLVGGAMSFSGVDQTSPIEPLPLIPPFNYLTGNGAGVSLTATTTTAGAVVVAALAVQATSLATPAVGQTIGWSRQTAGGVVTTNIRGASSWRGPVTAPGPVAMNWTVTPGQAWAYLYAVVRPARVSVAAWREQ